MQSAQIRRAFVDYFKRHGHTEVPSSSLIPENDPTLLFANAGMNQFKNTFLGLEKRDYNRAVTVQKCVRAGGKHNDLENVGFTARHHTFFEMLGNFSFGDYFKKDAMQFAWELLTKDLGIPKEKLYVTVFQSDDEAADIWHKIVGVPKDRIFRLGEKDNFWRMGDTGPCGPCSEIFYDHGPRAGKESDPFKGIVAGEDRFVEIWNLVFMQFFEKAPGDMEPLPKPSVDTGSGLERVVAALQGKFNNYDTDLFRPMLDTACGIKKWDFEDLLKMEDKLRDDPNARLVWSPSEVRENLAALRVMADHVRSGATLIADGALPSNEGRGYVLRRILRRGIRYGRKLSAQDSFLPKMTESYIDFMSSVYPELRNRKDVILATIEDEESRFLQTLDTGTEMLNQEISRLQKSGSKKIPGEFVFKLYDTYGFPADLTRVMAEEKQFVVDESEFEAQMDKARQLAKASWKGKSMNADEAHLITWSQELSVQGKTEFLGYDTLTANAKILGLSTGSAPVNDLKAGDTGLLITSKTPFYAEGGGQVGDTGVIRTKSGAEAQVLDTTKKNDLFIHHIEVTKGKLGVGDDVSLEVTHSVRRQTANNHSATHLLHAALRQILGTHVTQAGSLVDAEKLRFDFSHGKSVTKEEIEQIENLVNEHISLGHPVEPKVMSYKEAISAGAMALFGEKYGDEVRVLSMGNFSTELCGGTHVNNTAQIRLFKIVSESGVSAGVRRIEALTGDNAQTYLLKHFHENQRARQAAGISESWNSFLTSQAEASQWIENAKTQIRDLEKAVKQAKSGAMDVDSLLKEAKDFTAKSGAKAKVLLAKVDSDDREILAQWVDQLKNKIGTGVVALLGAGTPAPLIVAVSKDLNPGLQAGALLKELAAAMGGKGGGRPDFAQGSVPEPGKWADAVAKIQL